MQRFPRHEIVGVLRRIGYDHIDAAWAGAHGITVTNTPDVLTEEVADTALGLLLCTVREFPQAERYLRAGKWRAERLSAQQGDAARPHRRHGRHGPHRAGDRAPARRPCRCRWSTIRAGRPRACRYRHYPKLIDMARDVDVLLVITPGGAETKNLINAEVLTALGPDGILINMARGSVVDEAALIKALQDKTILSAGLDVYRARARSAAGADRDGATSCCFPISARRRSRPAREDGPAGGGQSLGLGGGQAAA